MLAIIVAFPSGDEFINLRGVLRPKLVTRSGNAVNQELLEGGGLEHAGAGISLRVDLCLDQAEQAANCYAGKYPEPDCG